MRDSLALAFAGALLFSFAAGAAADEGNAGFEPIGTRVTEDNGAIAAEPLDIGFPDEAVVIAEFEYIVIAEYEYKVADDGLVAGAVEDEALTETAPDLSDQWILAFVVPEDESGQALSHDADVPTAP